LSLTQSNNVFVGIHEKAINSFLKAFLTARSHYIRYGTSSFVPTTTSNATNIPPIIFPNIPGGIEYMIEFSIPIIDLFPPTNSGPLPPNTGGLGLHSEVKITILCNKEIKQGEKKPSSIPLTTGIEVFAKGKIVSTFFGVGTGSIGFLLEEIRIPNFACVGGKPDPFETILECIILMILKALLSGISIPFSALTIGFIQIILQRGPEIEEDQIKMWGDI
jgi:hypothetical protein